MLYSPARIDDENDLKCCSTDHKEEQMEKKNGKKWISTTLIKLKYHGC